eukprot:s155_g14.t1
MLASSSNAWHIPLILSFILSNSASVPIPLFPPLFLIRRLTEIFERHSTSLYILFLDWSQAFDSIGHPHLAAALRRYGVPPLMVQAIMALYHNGQFFVSDPFSDSPSFYLRRGIRQGCPLSPYLFIIVLSALTSDLHSFFQEIFGYTPWSFSCTHPLSDLEYADDTAVDEAAAFCIYDDSDEEHSPHAEVDLGDDDWSFGKGTWQLDASKHHGDDLNDTPGSIRGGNLDIERCGRSF